MVASATREIHALRPDGSLWLAAGEAGERAGDGRVGGRDMHDADAVVSNGVVTRCPLSTQVRAARRAVLRAMSATYPPVGQTLRPVFLDEAARHKPPRGDRWRAVRDVLSPGVHGKALTSCAHTKIKYEPSRYGAERENQCLPIALCAVQEAVLLRCLRTLSRRPIPATFKATVPSRAH